MDRFDSTLDALLGEKVNKDVVSLADSYVEIAKACKVYNEEIDSLVKQFLSSNDRDRDEIGNKIISKVVEALLK